MKTLLVTAFLALAIGACSSDNTAAPLVVSSTGTVPQGGSCSTTADCEAAGGLTCAYPRLDAGSSCPKTGLCVALGPFTVTQVCSCGGTTPVLVNAYVTPTYSSVPIGTGCSGTGGGSTDASTGGSTTGG